MAACLPDGDGDGFGLPGAFGCPGPRDCDDGDWFVNPGRLEVVAGTGDENCNVKTAMRATFAEGAFPPFMWVDVGAVSRPADRIQVGDGAAVGSSTRTLAMTLTTSVVVAVDVESTTGTGCRLGLGTSAAGTSTPVTTVSELITGTGVSFLSFVGDITPGRVLRKVQLSCDAGSSVQLDWLQVQDAEVEFPPPAELSIDWQDTRHPGGGHTTSVIRDDSSGTLYMGNDVGGAGRYESGRWQIANGEGATSLMAGGMLGVTDILPMEDGSGEVFALMGDANASDLGGGLWRTFDGGDSWEQLASSIAEYPPGAYPADTSDDVSGNPRQSNLFGRSGAGEFVQAGGRLLQAHSIPSVSGDVVYIANSDADVRGVSIHAAGMTCPLPNSGDPLPADYVGALLRVNALPYEHPVLVVGYRARVNSGASVFVCSLPTDGATCSGSSGDSADCQEVVVGLGGTDVRDLERDLWRADVFGDLTQTGVLIADAGHRPTDADADGIGDAATNGADGNVSQLLIFDDSIGNVTVIATADLITGADVSDVSYGADLTGISFDPEARYLFLNTPASASQRYSWDRLYRVDADDIFGGGTPVFEVANADDPGATSMSDESYYEWLRAGHDMDMAGAWLEAEVNGRANVFPARAAPGDLPDLVWLSFPFAAGEGFSLAAGITGMGAWLISALDQPWSHIEPFEEVWLGYPDTIANAEFDVKFEFWPGIDWFGHQSYQATGTKEVAFAADGHLWSAVGDQGISHLDATIPATEADPYGAEVDCLWHGWSASANSITAVPRRDTESGTDPVIWATLSDQSTEGFNHEMGVVRTMDNGATWEYAAAGFMSTPTAPFHNVVVDTWIDPLPETYGSRACRDLEEWLSAVPFPDLDNTDVYEPAHAFSQGATLEAAQDVDTPTLGQTRRIRALDEDAAIVLLGPDDVSTGGGEGGFYFTGTGGSTWELLDFDGGPGACSEQTTYGGAVFEIIHPGSDSWWENSWGFTQGEIQLLVSVVGAASTDCALAKVTMTDEVLGGLSMTWDWYSLPKVATTSWDTTPNACGVYYGNILGAVPAPWSNQAMIFAGYTRFYNPSSATVASVFGGACAVDLTTGVMSIVVDPREYAGGIRYAAPHPQVADLWAILPELDAGSYAYCAEQRNGNTSPNTWSLDCEVPTPMLATGSGAALHLTTLGSAYPHNAPITAAWSDINVADDSVDGVGSWLAVGTGGAGTWRGELSW